MPNRIIKESICISDSIGQLTFFQECLFYRLIVSCDDYGRYDGRAAVIKGRLFPLREDVELQMIVDGLNALSDAGIIGLYESHGKPYLYMKNWDAHQTVRNKRSKYPDPADCSEVIALESTCKQMQANAVPIQSNPIQSESNTESESESQSNAHARGKVIDTRFEIFYSEYPKKQDKAKAEKAFLALHASDELFEKIMDGLRRWKSSEQWTQKKYIPLPTVWIHGKRWEDEDIPQAGEANRSKNAALRYEQKPISKADFDAMVVNFDDESV